MKLSKNLSGGVAGASLGGAIATVIAAFLPWVKTTEWVGTELAGTNMTVIQTGIDGIAGIISLVVALTIVAIVVTKGIKGYTGISVALLGLLIMSIGVFKLATISPSGSPQIGLFITFLGGAGILGGGVKGYFSSSDNN